MFCSEKAVVTQLSVASRRKQVATATKAVGSPRLLLDHVIFLYEFTRRRQDATRTRELAGGRTRAHGEQMKIVLRSGNMKLLPKIAEYSSRCEGGGLIMAIDPARGSDTHYHSDFYIFAEQATTKAS